MATGVVIFDKVFMPWKRVFYEIRSRAFLLSLGLSLRDDGAVLLVREGFSAVYEAARADTLDESVWHFVDPYLPWFLATWDRCARLIRGVVQVYRGRDWPISEFLPAFTTEEQFGRALEEADRTYRGSRYVRRICELAKTHALPVAKYQK